jgi:hypothetical protein
MNELYLWCWFWFRRIQKRLRRGQAAKRMYQAGLQSWKLELQKPPLPSTSYQLQRGRTEWEPIRIPAEQKHRERIDEQLRDQRRQRISKLSKKKDYDNVYVPTVTGVTRSYPPSLGTTTTGGEYVPYASPVLVERVRQENQREAEAKKYGFIPNGRGGCQNYEPEDPPPPLEEDPLRQGESQWKRHQRRWHTHKSMTEHFRDMWE